MGPGAIRVPFRMGFFKLFWGGVRMPDNVIFCIIAILLLSICYKKTPIFLFAKLKCWRYNAFTVKYSKKEWWMQYDRKSNQSREGKVTYDIRFYVLTPDEKHVKIIMNLEAQSVCVI